MTKLIPKRKKTVTDPIGGSTPKGEEVVEEITFST
jgi:hypothetical protein